MTFSNASYTTQFNGALDHTGHLLPSLEDCWTTASPIRQVYWLWQLFDLWQLLSRGKQVASILVVDNIRVEGPCIRLVELIDDESQRARVNLRSHHALYWQNHLSNRASRVSSSGHASDLGRETRDGFASNTSDNHDVYVFGNTQDVDVSGDVDNVYAFSGADHIDVFDDTCASDNDRRCHNHLQCHQILGALWQSWVDRGHPALLSSLTKICAQLQQPTVLWSSITDQLNALLLEQAAEQPLRVAIAGGTTTGPNTLHNEDSCYPLNSGLDQVDKMVLDHDVSSILDTPDPWDELEPHVAIVCDGLGGHTGGEVASQLVVRSLKLQLGALLSEVSHQNTMSDVLPPDIVAEQLSATIRIVNNVLVAQNDSYRRTARQRMGTTVVMALQLPQSISTAQGMRNSHELYIASVGDSRAYWLTPTRCQLLTTDDRPLPQALARETNTAAASASNAPSSIQSLLNSRALTQALGMKDGEALTIHVQRFLIEEDGVLLLCSDGLSDGDRIETHWQALTTRILHDTLPLNQAVSAWLKIANQHNGHDNASVVLMRCQVSPQPSSDSALTHNPFSSSELSDRLILDSASLAPPSTQDKPAQHCLESHQQPLEACADVKRLAEKQQANQPPTPPPKSPTSKFQPPLSSAWRFPPAFPPVQQEMEFTEFDEQQQPSQSWSAMNGLRAYVLISGTLALGAIALGLTAWRYLNPILFDRIVVQRVEQWLEDRSER